MDSRILESENRLFEGTGGVSDGCRCIDLSPAFCDEHTGRVYRSAFPDGTPAPFHMLDGLPDELVVRRNPDGHVAAVKDSVVSGFSINGLFLTREQAARMVQAEVGENADHDTNDLAFASPR